MSENLVFDNFCVSVPNKESLLFNGVLRAGARLVFQGPSGCGKTTFLKAVAGLLLPSAGKLSLSEKDLTLLPPQRRHVGFVFQSAALFNHLNLIENIIFGLHFSEKSKAWSETLKLERAMNLLQRVGLSGMERRAVQSLSGGERQRVSLLRALIWEPKFLLLDEPLSAVDPELRRELQEWIIERIEESHVPALIISHDAKEAEILGTQVLDWQKPNRREAGKLRCFEIS